MREIPKTDYRNYISWAAGNSSNRVYPLSIAEGFQSGDIFVDDPSNTRAVLFWHYCGFGYICGEDPTEGFLDGVYEAMITERCGRRLVLITDNENVICYFRGKDVEFGLRAEYRYPCEKDESVEVGEGHRYFGEKGEPTDFSAAEDDTVLLKSGRFRIERIDECNIAEIRGRIIPAFSWESGERFLEKGFGYVAIARETVCAVAFSSAVSSYEVDIGVETCEGFRGDGLATALTLRMCGEIVTIGKKPVWAHAVGNIASMKTALRCGFVEDRVNTVIKKRGCSRPLAPDLWGRDIHPAPDLWGRDWI